MEPFRRRNPELAKDQGSAWAGLRASEPTGEILLRGLAQEKDQMPLDEAYKETMHATCPRSMPPKWIPWWDCEMSD